MFDESLLLSSKEKRTKMNVVKSDLFDHSVNRRQTSVEKNRFFILWARWIGHRATMAWKTNRLISSIDRIEFLKRKTNPHSSLTMSGNLRDRKTVLSNDWTKKSFSMNKFFVRINDEPVKSVRLSPKDFVVVWNSVDVLRWYLASKISDRKI